MSNGLVKTKLKITPLAVWICVILPVFENIIDVNFSQYTSKIHTIESMLLFGLTAFGVLKKRKITNELNMSNIKFFTITFAVLIIINLLTYFSAENIYIWEYIKFYFLHISFLSFLLIDSKFFFKDKTFNKYRYNYPILFFAVINYIGCFLIFIGNNTFTTITQGNYASIQRYYRYNLYQYSGVFAWPNHLSYVSLALYILCLYIPVNKYIKSSLVLLIFMSVNRTTIIIILGVIIFENYSFIRSKFKDIYLKGIAYIIFITITGIFLFIKYQSIKIITVSMLNEFFSLDSMGHRSLMIVDSFNVFKDHPMFGAGVRRIGELSIAINNQDLAILKYYPEVFSYVTSDTFFIVFAEVGIVGMSVLMLMLIRIYKDNDKNIKLVVTVLLIVSYSLYNPFSFILTTYIYCLLFVCYLKNISPYKGGDRSGE